MSRISREQVLHVAGLARLALAEDEVEALTSQLDTVLEYAQRLGSIDLTGVESASHPIQLQTPLREDRPEGVLPPERVVANAPERQETAFVVPKVLASDEV